MPNDRIDATQLFLFLKLMGASLLCIYAFYYLTRKLQKLVVPQKIRRSCITRKDLEGMLCDETAEPQALPLSLLEDITNGFSDEKQIGTGGFAVVYKGKLENRTVAVKKLSVPYKYEKEFEREVMSLMIAKHKNVVRFLGYCADRQMHMEKYEGRLVPADVHQRLLCFEYLPRGSLHEYLTDTSRKPWWRECYQIITGICQGLHYLHHKNIVHFNLKTHNILLDYSLVAKIADFGLARCFIGETESQIISAIGGTWVYMAPECFDQVTQVTRRDSFRLDIYSLGVVIMEILMKKSGEKDRVVDNVVKSWSNLSEISQRDRQLEQVRVCAEIGTKCIDVNPANRPDTQHIINRLDEIETVSEYIKTGVTTSQQAEHALNELQQGIPNSRGETSLKENASAVTVAGTNSCNSIWENTANIDKLNEIMRSLNLDIRGCFEFCSIFPKGSKLRRDELVRLWIAQGFVKTSSVTDDMEDIAGGYIQELVACSFLQPIGDSIEDCFTIPDALHDILDKVAGNCFRIENARSPDGEGWEGDVPLHIQHLFIQNYDGKLITETIIGLECLRTLIVYVVGKYTPVEEKVFESICKRLPKLRVLAIAFSQNHDEIEQTQKFSIPESVGKLKYLRYLAFRTDSSCKITLPSTLNNLQHIQVLDFGGGKILEFTFAELVNLRHIFCWPLVKLPFVGRLRSLQTLPVFKLSKEQGCELKELRDLNKLRGELWISDIQYVKTKGQALEANLAAKRLTNLALRWGYGRCSPEVSADVLEGLCPPMELKILRLEDFVGRRYPDWMMGKHSGGPKDLQELQLWNCTRPAFVLAEAFPHLRVLEFIDCSWVTLPDSIEYLTSLKKLLIFQCKNIQSLPSLPLSLEEFSVSYCDDEFMESCQTVGHPNWQTIEHIPAKKIRR